MPRPNILLEQRQHASEPRNGNAIKRRFSLRLWLTEFAILIPVWFILVGAITSAELAVGLVAVAIAATVTEVTRSTGFARFYPRLQWLTQIWRVPGEILSDCGILAFVLARRILRKRQKRGFFKIIPFNSGGTGARAAARRAIAITVGTLTPNTCVLDIEPHHNFALLHQLRASRSTSFVRDVGQK